MSVRSRIFSAMQQIAEEQKVTLPPLQDDLPLHETGFEFAGVRDPGRAAGGRSRHRSVHHRGGRRLPVDRR